MEQAERVDLAVSAGSRTEKGYEKYGWIFLVASAIFGIIAAVVTTLPPISWFWDPLFVSGYSIMGAWGVSWVGFNILALVLSLVPYRRSERWAWYTLWMLPLMWLSQFVLAPDLPYYLVLAVITTLGLILPYRRFFTGAEERSV